MPGDAGVEDGEGLEASRAWVEANLVFGEERAVRVTQSPPPAGQVRELADRQPEIRHGQLPLPKFKI
jgi:hypothetical protein